MKTYSGTDLNTINDESWPGRTSMLVDEIAADPVIRPATNAPRGRSGTSG
jgi:hypothetical protein